MSDSESRFLASGAYGCIYHPPYDCKGKDLKDKSHVTKLVKDEYTSQTEYDVSTLLKGIEGFLLIDKKCNINSTSIQPMVKGCDLIEKKDPKIEKKYILLYSKFIHGTELVNYMKKQFTIEKFIKTMLFLCTQIEKLIDNKIIHHDLHFGNVMYDYDNNKMVVIDFGLAIIASKFYKHGDKDGELNYPYLKDAIFNYTPSWQYFSIDEHLLGYMVHEGHLTERVIQDTLDEYLETHLIKKLPIYKHYRETSLRYFKRYIGKPRESTIRKFLSWWNTWDYYKISLHLLNIYIKMNVDYPELYMLLLMMIHPIPKYRPSVIDMNKNINILLKSYSSKIPYSHSPDSFDKELIKSITIKHNNI
jgi:hypothetical protein